MLSSRFFGGTFRSQTVHVFFSSGSGSSCTKGMEMEEEACNSLDCPCELEETEWTEWSDCTVGCGDSGTGTRCSYYAIVLRLGANIYLILLLHVDQVPVEGGGGWNRRHLFHRRQG